jgi:SM-20-related protein
LQQDFETLINSFIENKIGICDHFIQENLATHLKMNLLSLHQQKLLLKAGVGNDAKLQVDKLIRSDSIYWLDRVHDNNYETEFLDLIDGFIKYLNMSCYAGITSSEFHYSLYEKNSFYKTHLDQFENNSSRKFSMISYLNKDWKTNDGGELMIHQNSHHQSISPIQGKTILFKSNELLHEVLLTNQRRFSITGWLKTN